VLFLVTGKLISNRPHKKIHSTIGTEKPLVAYLAIKKEGGALIL